MPIVQKTVHNYEINEIYVTKSKSLSCGLNLALPEHVQKQCQASLCEQTKTVQHPGHKFSRTKIGSVYVAKTSSGCVPKSTLVHKVANTGQ